MPDTQIKNSPISGSEMDRAVPRSKYSRRLLVVIGIGVLVALAVAVFLVAPSGKSQMLDADRVTISPVTKGVFEDFIPVRGRVTPLVTVYLDAVEGGRIEKVLIDDGASVEKGQLLVVLSNTELQLSTLARQTEVEQQLNNMRSQELALARSNVQNQRDIIEAELETAKAERLYRIQEPLAKRGFVAGKEFKDTTDQYRAEKRRLAALREGVITESRLQASQLAQLRAAADALSSSLAIARSSLDQLNLRAPVAGQLTAFSAQVGQSMSRGERIGQIDSPGRNKLVADIDEFYIDRVALSQPAELEWNKRKFKLKVSKISPQVRNGEFKVDFQFIGPQPQGMQRGQTLQARLTLGDPAPALLIPNGAFYNETAGAWVFVVTADGTEAMKRAVRLGRRNAQFIEVLDGLEPGERVLTSPYTGLADKDQLKIEEK